MHLAKVVDNDDPDARGRVKVRLLATGLEVWAAVVTHSAGAGYGISALPRLEELVVVGFVAPEMPLVLGAIWSGGNSHPDEARPVEENYTLRTPEGSQIRLDDANGPKIEIKTSSGYLVRITEEGGGTILLEKGSEKVEMSSSGISITAGSEVSIEAGQVKISAGTLTVDAGMSNFSGVVKCDALISNSVVGTTYTPGAGNIW